MTTTDLPNLTLVLGGASSGKTGYAEGLVLASGRRPVYVATAQGLDHEMIARIERHQATRAAHGWHTIEEPLDLPTALARADAGDAVLVDCATLWLTNLCGAKADVVTAKTELLAAIDLCPAPVVIVSNEIGHGIVPMDHQTRHFRDAHGRLNRRLADHAQLVVFVMAGLPLVLKGQLP